MGPPSKFHTWNYRIVEDRNGELSIHEVYYDDNGVPTDWTTDGVSPYGDTMQELNSAYNMMSDAFYEPVLKWVGTEDAPKLEEHPVYQARKEIAHES